MSDMFKKNIVKASIVASACFAAGIIFFSIGSMIDGNLITPMQNLLILGESLAIGVLTLLRLTIDRSRWALSGPHILKNFIFAPFYLAIALVTVSLMFGGPDPGYLLLAGGIFLGTFLVLQTVLYFVSKKDTDHMNDALREFLKEHTGDEEG